jgi:hypothetical protein
LGGTAAHGGEEEHRRIRSMQVPPNSTATIASNRVPSVFRASVERSACPSMVVLFEPPRR